MTVQSEHYGTAILPNEYTFVQEVVQPGDELFVPHANYTSKAETVTYQKAKIIKKFPFMVTTSLGPKTYADIVLGYRYTVKQLQGEQL